MTSTKKRPVTELRNAADALRKAYDAWIHHAAMPREMQTGESSDFIRGAAAALEWALGDADRTLDAAAAKGSR